MLLFWYRRNFKKFHQWTLSPSSGDYNKSQRWKTMWTEPVNTRGFLWVYQSDFMQLDVEVAVNLSFYFIKLVKNKITKTGRPCSSTNTHHVTDSSTMWPKIANTHTIYPAKSQIWQAAFQLHALRPTEGKTSVPAFSTHQTCTISTIISFQRLLVLLNCLHWWKLVFMYYLWLYELCLKEVLWQNINNTSITFKNFLCKRQNNTGFGDMRWEIIFAHLSLSFCSFSFLSFSALASSASCRLMSSSTSFCFSTLIFVFPSSRVRVAISTETDNVIQHCVIL